MEEPYYVYIPSWFIGRMRILGYSLLVVLLTFLIVFFSVRKIIIRDWSYYKCNSIITTFAGVFGKDANKTRKECFRKKVEESSGEVLDPYDDVINVQKQNSKEMTKSISSMRSVLNSFKENFMKSIQNVLDKFKNIGSSMQYLMMKIQSIFQKILALYITLLYFAWSLLKGLEAIIRDPKVLKSQALIEKGINVVANPPKLKNVGKAIKKGVKKVSKKAKKKSKKLKKKFK
tara:strand:- start:7631 stop:8323 length:693 start_codon:yes stop_codon:yes gene_type:complete